MELLLRFFIGGTLVCLFAAMGECIQPKSFAGIFGAAPSVALSGLLLTLLHHSPGLAVVEARSMVFGSVALGAYGLACAKFVKKPHVPPWLSAGLLWILWLAVALLFKVVLE